MLDLVRVVTLAFALVSAARQRFALGVAAALLVSYALAAATLGVAGAVRRGAVGGEYAFGLLFLGPSAIPTTERVVLPGGAWMAAHPMASAVGTAALGLVALAWAWRRSTRLSPHSVKSRRWDTISASFVLLAAIDLTRIVVGALMRWVMARQEV
jgi:hypothetical protein